MINEELIALVKEEAQKLRQHATSEERQKLNFGTFDPTDQNGCIYGQITGDCHGIKAINLLSECAVPYSNGVCLDIDVDDPLIFLPERVRANRSFQERESTYNIRAFFSPIEFYIAQEGAKNKELIAYLKGETADLEL